MFLSCASSAFLSDNWYWTSCMRFYTTFWNSFRFLIAPSFAWEERFGGEVFWKRSCYISRSALIFGKPVLTLPLAKSVTCHRKYLNFKILPRVCFIKFNWVNCIDKDLILFQDNATFDALSCFVFSKVVWQAFGLILSANLVLSRSWSVQQSASLMVWTLEILEVLMTNNDIINYMPVFRTGVLPCILVFVFLSKLCVFNHKIMLVAKLLKLKTIAVCITYSTWPQTVPSLRILSYSSIQITEQHDQISIRNTEKHLS